MIPSVSDIAPDRAVSIRGDRLLRPFHEAGVLSTADVQIATALLRIVGHRSATEDDERVRLAAALCVQALRRGSITVDLDSVADTESHSDDGRPITDLPWPQPDLWRASLAIHPLVHVTDGPAQRPLVWADGRLYLQKYRMLETAVAESLVTLRQPVPHPASDPDIVDGLVPGPGPSRQRLALAAALTHRLTILAGGPGTGKTTTIAGIIAALRRHHGPDLAFGLAAPTGKAAARMQATTNATLSRLPDRHDPVEAVTLHRLLGWRPDPERPFRHDRDHPLPHDVVIIDETSMVDLAMMHCVLQAVRTDARLILVGDPAQLASIDVGAVLGDIVAVPGPAPVSPALHSLVPLDDPTLITGCGTVTLTRTWRYEGTIARLAVAIDSGDADEVVRLLRSGADDVRFTDSLGSVDTEALRSRVTAWAREVDQCAASGDAAGALEALDRFRVLCAHRHGPAGVSHWNALIRSWVPQRRGGDTWEIGQGVIVTENDYALGVRNGDAGVVVAGPDGEPVVAFSGVDEPLLIPPIRLDAVMALDAMTVHRAQGSQFDDVTVVLPDPGSPLLTRELLYTAVTRARSHVRVIGSEESVRAAVGHRVVRASQLTDRLSRAFAQR